MKNNKKIEEKILKEVIKWDTSGKSKNRKQIIEKAISLALKEKDAEKKKIFDGMIEENKLAVVLQRQVLDLIEQLKQKDAEMKSLERARIRKDESEQRREIRRLRNDEAKRALNRLRR